MQKHKALAFTGHRPESLPFGENELSASAIRIKTMLADEIMRCAAQGYDTFLAGGARGEDILFAEQVLFVKGLEYLKNGKRNNASVVNRCMLCLDADNADPGLMDDLDMTFINAYALYSMRRIRDGTV